MGSLLGEKREDTGRNNQGALGESPSINCLLRRHCRERLFVPPLQWTNRQLDLLQCSFVARTGTHSRRPAHHPACSCRRQPGEHAHPSLPSPSPSPSPTSDSAPGGVVNSTRDGSSQHDVNGDDHNVGDQKQNQAYGAAESNARRRYAAGSDPIRHVRTALSARGSLMREVAVVSLLDSSPLQFDVKRPQLDFCFGDTSERPLRFPIKCLVFQTRPDRCRYSRTDPSEHLLPPFPQLLWLDLPTHITTPRAETLRSSTRRNEPVAALRRIYLNHITPTHRYRDPYIVAALIALAQAQKKCEERHGYSHNHERGGSGGNHQVFTTRLILADPENCETVHVYTAEISAAFLDKLARPGQASATDAAMEVVASEIRARPLRSFRARLLEHLFLGEQEEQVERGQSRHDVGKQQQQKQHGTKRSRRESTEEKRELEERGGASAVVTPSGPLKIRRLDEQREMYDGNRQPASWDGRGHSLNDAIRVWLRALASREKSRAGHVTRQGHVEGSLALRRSSPGRSI